MLTTPETSGASPLACRIADAVLSMEAFRPLLESLEGRSCDSKELAAAVARRIDAEGVGYLVKLAKDLRARLREKENPCPTLPPTGASAIAP